MRMEGTWLLFTWITLSYFGPKYSEAFSYLTEIGNILRKNVQGLGYTPDMRRYYGLGNKCDTKEILKDHNRLLKEPTEYMKQVAAFYETLVNEKRLLQQRDLKLQSRHLKEEWNKNLKKINKDAREEEYDYNIYVKNLCENIPKFLEYAKSDRPYKIEIISSYEEKGGQNQWTSECKFTSREDGIQFKFAIQSFKLFGQNDYDKYLNLIGVTTSGLLKKSVFKPYDIVYYYENTFLCGILLPPRTSPDSYMKSVARMMKNKKKVSGSAAIALNDFVDEDDGKALQYRISVGAYYEHLLSNNRILRRSESYAQETNFINNPKYSDIAKNEYRRLHSELQSLCQNGIASFLDIPRGSLVENSEPDEILTGVCRVHLDGKFASFHIRVVANQPFLYVIGRIVNNMRTFEVSELVHFDRDRQVVGILPPIKYQSNLVYGQTSPVTPENPSPKSPSIPNEGLTSRPSRLNNLQSSKNQKTDKSATPENEKSKIPRNSKNSTPHSEPSQMISHKQNGNVDVKPKNSRAKNPNLAGHKQNEPSQTTKTNTPVLKKKPSS